MLALLAGVGIEVAGTSLLATSDGFRHVAPTLGGLALWAVALYLFILGLRTKPVAAAYAIWSGTATALLVLIAWLGFDQRPGVEMFVGCGLIVTGLALLRNVSLEPDADLRHQDVESAPWAG